VQAPPLRRRPQDAELPLAFAQERFWFLDQLERDNALYNITTAVRLEGRLNVSALEQTLTEIARRHEVLRTTFATVAGRPVQVVAPAAGVQLPVAHWPARADKEAGVARFIRQETERPLDSTNGPLWRAGLLRLDEDEHVLLVTMHHIISDGWSLGVLVKELAALYAAYAQGEESPLAELSIQFADYALWQREWLQGEALAAQLAYWRRQLEDAPAILELPTDKPRPALQNFQGTTQSFVLPPAVSEGLKALSRREGVTLFMTLLAGFQVLLERYTGQEEFVVGTGIANRTQLETEHLVGCFVNFLALRADLSRNPSVRELLRRVRETTLGAYAHQDIPFEKLLEALQPERRPGYPPLFQVALFLQNVPHTTLELPGLKLTPIRVAGTVAKFDLMLVLDEGAQGLKGIIEYRTDLFEAATIARMLSHFQALLRDMVEHPEKDAHSLVMTTETEQQQLSYAFDDDLGSY
jgi:Condensation domain